MKSLIEAESPGSDAPDTSEIVDRLVDRSQRKAPPETLPRSGSRTAPVADAIEGEAAPGAGRVAAGRRVRPPRPGDARAGVRAQVGARVHGDQAAEPSRARSSRRVPSAREIEDEQFDDSFDVVVRTLATADEVVGGRWRSSPRCATRRSSRRKRRASPRPRRRRRSRSRAAGRGASRSRSSPRRRRCASRSVISTTWSTSSASS